MHRPETQTSSLPRAGEWWIGGLFGLALGGLLAVGWSTLPAAAWWALMACVAVAAAVLWRHRVHAARRAAIDHDLQQERLHQLERRARQFDVAEQLVDLASFDWFPRTDALHWSEQHYRLWGYEPGMVTPNVALFQQHIHPDDLDRVSSQLQQALEGKLKYDCVHRVLRSDGSVRTVRGQGEVFFDAQGQAERMIGAVLDITERVTAESSQRVFAFVFDAITDPVSVIDTGLRYRLANKAWRDINQRSLDDTLGRSFDEVFPQVISPARRQAAAESAAGREGLSVRDRSPSQGTLGRRIETRYFPFHDPAVDWRGVVMISRDVTEEEAVQAALAHGIDNLRLTLNTIGDAIFATDALGPDDPVLFVNDQLLTMWQIDLQPGQALTALLIIDCARRLFRNPDAEVARIQAIIQGNEDADDRIELNDGRVLQGRCRATLSGSRYVRVWAFRDVTGEALALQSLAEAEARQRTLLAAFPGFIWVIDSEERLVYLNPPAAEVYHPRVPLPGVDIVQLFGSRVADRARPLIRRALAGETETMEWHRESASGRTPDDLLLKVVPGSGPDGRALCYAFGIDISALKRTQAELEAARDEAERANQAKTQFLSSMSHELRTPLNAIIGFSQVLEQNTGRNLNERQVRQIGEIRRAGNHLLELINDLLDLARIEAGRSTLTLVPVPLAEAVDEALRLVQPLALQQGRRLRLAPAGPVTVNADRTRLKQVLLNLLSNAIKYNRDDGEVLLSWRQDGQRVRVDVCDQGQGLTAQEQARLFKPFERLDADSGLVPGTGIGLALSRELVKLMHGDIGVRSVVGEGSCFWLDLPVATVPLALPPVAPPLATASPATAPAARSARPARLLYVDDNPVNLALMEGLFEERQDLRLVTLGDPTLVLASLLQEPTDVLLVDLHMPRLDGFELLAQLRAQPAFASTPAIAVSADTTSLTRDRCRALGFFDHVAKPVDAALLFAAVDRALQHLADAAGAARAGPPS